MLDTIAIVQARMGSTRFPGKCMAILDGRPLLAFLLERLKGAEQLSSIIVATTLDPKDDVIARLAQQMNVPCVRGPDEDVLGRFLLASSQHPSRFVVRVCADNPFTDPAEVDCLVQFLLGGKYDYAYNNRAECGLPDGVGAEAVPMGMLTYLDNIARTPRYREHVLLYMYEHSAEFRVGCPETPAGLRRPELRTDVDYPDDLEFLRSLCDHLPKEKAPLWSTADVIAAIDQHPELLRLRKDRSFA